MKNQRLDRFLWYRNILKSWNSKLGVKTLLNSILIDLTKKTIMLIRKSFWFLFNPRFYNRLIMNSSNVSKEYSVFSRTSKLYWFWIRLSRNENNASSNVFKAQNWKWSPRERCRCWSTLYETKIAVESQAKLTESAFHLSLIKLSKMTTDCS